MPTVENLKRILLQSLPSYLPEEVRGCEIKVKTISTPKGEKTELFMDRPGVTPTVFLENYQDRTDSLAVVKEIANILSVSLPKFMEKDPEEFIQWDYAKDYLIFEVVGKEKQAELVNQVPHLDLFGDLTAVFKILIEPKAEIMGKIKVQKEFLSYWGKTEKELFEIAMDNSKRILEPKVVKSPMLPMWMVSNFRWQKGAAAVLYSDFLPKTAGIFREDFFVIPSSIHEMICVPVGAISKDHDILNDIREINGEIPDKNILSDHLFRYHWDTGELTVEE